MKVGPWGKKLVDDLVVHLVEVRADSWAGHWVVASVAEMAVVLGVVWAALRAFL